MNEFIEFMIGLSLNCLDFMWSIKGWVIIGMCVIVFVILDQYAPTRISIIGTLVLIAIVTAVGMTML